MENSCPERKLCVSVKKHSLVQRTGQEIRERKKNSIRETKIPDRHGETKRRNLLSVNTEK